MEREIVEHEHPVAVADLDRCLRHYWDDCGPDDERPVHRALTMNLIAVAPAADESLLREMLGQLRKNDPCVAVLVLMDDHERPLEARFATHVELRPNSRTVLLEQIALHVSAREQRKLPSIIRPLLFDDVPTKALWIGALPDDLRLLQELGALADLLIYDSSMFAQPEPDIARIEALSLPTADLTWSRLEPWRHALAAALEHVDWPPAEVPRARIRNGGGAGSRAASIRLSRWLHERLAAEVAVIEDPAAGSPRCEPSGAELDFDTVHVRIVHRRPANVLETSVTLADRCIVPFTTVSSAAPRSQLLAEAAQRLDAVTAPPEHL